MQRLPINIWLNMKLNSVTRDTINFSNDSKRYKYFLPDQVFKIAFADGISRRGIYISEDFPNDNSLNKFKAIGKITSFKFKEDSKVLLIGEITDESSIRILTYNQDKVNYYLNLCGEIVSSKELDNIDINTQYNYNNKYFEITEFKISNFVLCSYSDYIVLDKSQQYLMGIDVDYLPETYKVTNSKFQVKSDNASKYEYIELD